MIIGYARVSGPSQNFDGQVEALRAAGAEVVYAEKESGVKQARPELARALAALKPGDVLMVKCIDRLARSTLDLLTLIEQVGKAGAGFRSLQEAWIDTTTPHGMMILTVIGGVAAFERSLILSRTAQGRERAMAKGIRFGPKPKLSPLQITEARRRVAEGETPTHIAALFGVSRQTISRALGAI